MALDAEVDRAQLEYFENCGAVTGEPVVLFVAAPLWTYAEHRGEQLYRFERAAIHDKGLTLVLVMSGDRHYYIRRESSLPAETGGRRVDAPPRITAGLGGAYRHPPHLGKTVPMLWEAESDRHGASRRTLPYVAAQLPGGTPFERTRLRREESPPPEVSYPTERQSRRLVGLRHSFVAWWRWNRSFTVLPFVICLMAATTTLQTSDFWRQDADFSETTFLQLGAFFAISFNLLIILLLFGVAAVASAPDPAARFQRTQRWSWTVLHWAALSGALWGTTWLAQKVAKGHIKLRGVLGFFRQVLMTPFRRWAEIRLDHVSLGRRLEIVIGEVVAVLAFIALLIGGGFLLAWWEQKFDVGTFRDSVELGPWAILELAALAAAAAFLARAVKGTLGRSSAGCAAGLVFGTSPTS